MSSPKRRAIILFKFQQNWNEAFVETLSENFLIESLFAEEIINQKGSRYLVDFLNKKISDSNISVVLFDVDFYPAIDAGFIGQINVEKKVLISFDDLVFHYRNCITAAGGGCDLVFTADPLSVLKYEEEMINAQLLFSDTNLTPESFTSPIPKTNDVLFFGDIGIGNRREYIEYLTANGVHVKVVGGGNYISKEDLINEIRASKIVLNLSESFNSGGVRKTLYKLISPFCVFAQFKLRIIEAGLLNVACISEFAPAIALMYSNNEVPVFHNKEECLTLINDLLANDEKLITITNALHDTSLNKYTGSVLASAAAKKIETSIFKKINVDIPVEYHIDTLIHRIKIVYNHKHLKLSWRELVDFDYPKQLSALSNARIYLSGLFVLSDLILASITTRLRLAAHIFSPKT